MMTCHRKLQYRSLAKRIAAVESPALNFGTAQHLGMELRYLRHGSQPVDSHYFDDLALLFTKFYESHPTSEGDFRTLNWAIEVNRRYCDKYGVEPFSLLRYKEPQPCPHCENGSPRAAGSAGLNGEPLGANAGPSSEPPKCPFCLGSGKRDLMVEMSFALPLYTHLITPQECLSLTRNGATVEQGEIPVFYTGRIDLPILYDGEIFINDFKTTSMLGQQFWDGLKRSSQQKGYCWAFQELTGQPVAGYQITAIRSKEPPLYVTQGKPSSRTGKQQSPESWWDESFQRQIFRVSPEELIKWKRNTVDLVERFFWHYSRGYMPEETIACTQWGRCPYYDVCLMADEDQDVYLQSGLFTDNIWTPLSGVISKP